jgi:hypothetical protein
MAITWDTVDLPLTGQEQSADEGAAAPRPRAVRNVKLDHPGALRKRGGFREAAQTFDAAGSLIGRMTRGPNGGVRADLASGLVAFADSAGQLTRSGAAFESRLLLSGVPSPSVPVSRTLEASASTYGWAHTVDLVDFTVVFECSERDTAVRPAPRITVLTRDGELLLDRVDAAVAGLLANGAGPAYTVVSNGVTNSVFYAARDPLSGQVSCVVLSFARSIGGINITAGTTFAVAIGASFDVAVGALGTYLLLITEATGCRLYIRSAAGAAVANAVIGSLGTPSLCALSTKIVGLAASGRVVVAMSASPSIQARLVNVGASSITPTGALFTQSVAHVALSAAVAREAGSGIEVAGYVVLVTQPTLLGTLTPCTEWYAIDVGGLAAGTTALAYAVPHGKSWSPTDGRVITPCRVSGTTNVGGAAVTTATRTFDPVGHGLALIEPATQSGTGAGGYTSNAVSLLGWAAFGRAFQPSVTAATTPYPNPTYTGTFDEPEILAPTTQFDRRTTVTTTLRAVAYRYPLPGTLTRNAGSPDVGGCVLLPDAAPRLSAGPTQLPAGYPHPPEILRASQVVAASSWPAASMSWRARYVWYDSQNNELTSAWSLPTQIATPNTVSDIQLDLRLPGHLQGFGVRVEFAYALGGSSEFFVALSSTTAGGPRLASQTADAAGGALSLTYFVRFAAIDAVIPVDTRSLPNVLPPSVSYVCQHRDRTLLLSAEGPTLWVSKPNEAGVLPEWPVELALPLPPWVGRAVAVESLGGRIVVLGSQGCAAWSGDGPNAFGEGSPLSGPDEIGRGIACTSGASVLNAPEGLWFDSDETLCLLTQGGELRPEGRAADADLAELSRPLAATYWRELDARVWLRSDELAGEAGEVQDLLIRWGSGEWSRWVLRDGFDYRALLASGRQLWLGQSSQLVRYDETDNGLDDGSGSGGSTLFPALDYQNAHLQGGYTSDFQACRGIELTVDCRRVGVPVRVRAYFDRSSVAGYDKTLNTAQVGPHQLEFRVEPAERQKCSAVRWQITDAAATSGSAGDGRAGVDLLGATVTLGQRARRGPRRQPPTRRA